MTESKSKTAAAKGEGYPDPKHLEGCPESRPGAIEHRTKTFVGTTRTGVHQTFEVKISRCRECGQAARSPRKVVD